MDEKLINAIGRCLLDARKILSLEEYAELKTTCLNDDGYSHFGFGLWVRNTFIHPKSGNELREMFRKNGYEQADDMSSVILLEWRKILSEGGEISG